jgi:alpha-tubulin suppressor-like RCC1 family protein
MRRVGMPWVVTLATALACTPFQTASSPADGGAAAQDAQGKDGSAAVVSPAGCTDPACIARVALGDWMACAERLDGKVFCWGRDDSEQVGDQQQRTEYQPAPPTFIDGLASVAQLALGGGHSCAIRTDGTPVCWGYNGHGQLGRGDTDHQHGDFASPKGLTKVDALALGDWSTCALAGGVVRCWGANDDGQLGLNDNTNDHDAPSDPVPNVTASAIASGPHHVCAIVGADHSVSCWGLNDHGQCTGSDNPAGVVTVPGVTGVTGLALGAGHTCASISGGHTVCWGDGSHGKLGDASFGDRHPPTQASTLDGLTDLVAGTNFTCGLDATRQVRCWGKNDKGQINATLGTPTDSGAPLSPLDGAVGVVGAAAGQAGSYACASQGTALLCWGDNSHGQLGDVNLTTHTAPFTVPAAK